MKKKIKRFFAPLFFYFYGDEFVSAEHYVKLLQKIEMLRKDLIFETEENKRLNIKLEETQDEDDLFFVCNYKSVDNIAYKDKRQKGSENFINEFITPNAFKILKFKKKFNNIEFHNNLDMAKKVGNEVSKSIKWTSDKETQNVTDHYAYPEETLTTFLDDCEGSAFVLSSLYPKIFKVAFGFYDNGKDKFGHAFNVFEHNDKLYIVDASGVRVHTELWKSNKSKYEIHLIITQKNTFKLGNVNFGHKTKM
jgi:hypothetical protein